MKCEKGLCVLLLAFMLMLQPVHGTEIRRNLFVPQTVSVKSKCFPIKLLSVLAFINKETKGKVIVTSGHRPHGRRASLHRSCKAADIRVPGYSTSSLRRIARRAPGIGGIGAYRRQPGLLHVDVGSRREWTH